MSSVTASGSFTRPRLALVGNAPLRTDFSRMIDDCEFVIRCNEAKNLGGFSGTRTDVLCVNNTGATARRMIREQSLRRAPRFPDLKEIWIPRVSEVHLTHLRKAVTGYPESQFDDHTDELLSSNGLTDLPVTRFTREFNLRVFNYLSRGARARFICPSTGFLALGHILESDRYAGYQKQMFGFTFEMWWGHPADAERDFVARTCAKREDLQCFL